MLNALFKACDAMVRVVGGATILFLFSTIQHKDTLEIKRYHKESKD